MIDEELAWECYRQVLCPASILSRLLAAGLAARHSQVWGLVALCLGTQFTCFTSTKVQMLTPEELLQVSWVELESAFSLFLPPPKGLLPRYDMFIS